VEHLLTASGVGACIDVDVASKLIAINADLTSVSGLFDSYFLYQAVLSGGDDYELAFTAPCARHAQVLAAARTSSTPVTCIGRIQAAPGLRLVDAAGQPVQTAARSFDHFA